MEKEQLKIFSERLTKLRQKKELTQQQLGEALQIPRVSITRYETAERTPTVDHLVQFAQFFNVPSDYLLGLSSVESYDTELQAICKYTGLNEKAIKNLSITKNQFQGNEFLITLSELMTNRQLFELCEHLTTLKGLSKAYGYDPNLRDGEFIFLFDPNVATHISKSEYCDIIRYRATRLLEKMLNEYDVREQVENNMELKIIIKKDGEENGEHNPSEE